MPANTSEAEEEKTPDKKKNNWSTVVVTLPQLLDLALGTPEVGVVNLNILHNFLHVLLQQINLRTTRVEFRGEDAKRLETVIASMRSGPNLHLYENKIISGSNEIKQRIHSTDQLTIKVDVIKQDENSGKSVSAPVSPRKTEQQVTHSTNKTQKHDKKSINLDSTNESENYVYVESIIDGLTPTAYAFNQLEQSVQRLEQQFEALKELSTNSELIERLKGNLTDPLTDMWNIISINKRLDATEKGIQKLTSMIQELIKSEKDITYVVTQDETKTKKKSIEKVRNPVVEEETITDMTENPNIEKVSNPVVAEKNITDMTEKKNIKKVGNPGIEGKTITGKTEKKNIEKVRNPVVEEKNITDGNPTSEAKMKTEGKVVNKSDDEEEEEIFESNGARDQIISACLQKCQALEMTVDSEIYGIHIELELLQEARNRLEKELENISSTITSTENENMEDSLSKIQDFIDNNVEVRIQRLENENLSLMNKLKNIILPGESEEKNLDDMVAKIQEIQEDIRKLTETANILMNDTANRKENLNAILEQMQCLQTIKADKEELEDILADIKADTQTVNRKVSHEKFDAACDNLTQGVQQALDQINQQNSDIVQLFDEVQKEIEKKVDKIEVAPLQDFIINQLKLLGEKIKQAVKVRSESEAAGTKKILRGVQCISCNKNTVMRMEETGKIEAPAMPCSKSMRPYLTYELDQVRRQQRRLPYSKDMNKFDAATLETMKKLNTKNQLLSETINSDHTCNRYCGGSHTITIPQQRVRRVGHVFKNTDVEIKELADNWLKKYNALQSRDGKMQCGDDKTNQSQSLQTPKDVCAKDVPWPACEVTCPADEIPFLSSEVTQETTSTPPKTSQPESSQEKKSSGRKNKQGKSKK